MILQRYWCRRLESVEDNRLLNSTANDMESDMLRGFELGADDYVTKSFPISVFQKKVSTLFAHMTKQTGAECYDDGNLMINFSEITAALAGEPVTFTPLAYRLLKVLVKNPGTVLTRQVLRAGRDSVKCGEVKYSC